VRVDASFDAFVEARSTALLRTAYLLTGDHGHAEDLLQLIGDERIGGRDTVHLRLTGRTQGGLPQIDLWVDASTFLPVRLVGTKGVVTSAIDYTWLTRTGANLAKTDLTVPAGYTHRDTPPAQPAQPKPAN